MTAFPYLSQTQTSCATKVQFMHCSTLLLFQQPGNQVSEKWEYRYSSCFESILLHQRQIQRQIWKHKKQIWHWGMNKLIQDSSFYVHWLFQLKNHQQLKSTQRHLCSASIRRTSRTQNEELWRVILSVMCRIKAYWWSGPTGVCNLINDDEKSWYVGGPPLCRALS